MRNIIAGTIGCVFAVLGLVATSGAGETKGEMEKAKGDMKGQMEETKGEMKGMKEDAKGNEMKAAMERAK
ncbi:MAG: hypothetical protein ABIU05_10570, partial [Nitrospirales bacterium]